MQVAALSEGLSFAQEKVWAAYLRVYQYRPQRAEALCELARLCRENSDYALAYLFASAASTIPYPSDQLFIDQSVYDWRALDEYAVAAYWVGKPQEAVIANQRLLSEGKLPESEVARVRSNLAYSLN
jgi:hypothetical protein